MYKKEQTQVESVILFNFSQVEGVFEGSYDLVKRFLKRLNKLPPVPATL